MSLAVVRSRAPASGRAPEVTVEVHLANGLPSFSIVGLPDLEVRESRERVRAALQNCDFDFPVRRIIVFFQTSLFVKFAYALGGRLHGH